MSNSNDSRLARSELKPTAAIRTSPALVKAMGITFVASLIGLGIACQLKAPQQQELHKQLIAASLALLFGACFGGIVKMLLDEAVAEKRRRDDAAAFVANVLADLKKVYDHVERARLLIPAHQSAKTYGDEMREDVTAGGHSASQRHPCLARSRGRRACRPAAARSTGGGRNEALSARADGRVL